MNLMKQMCNGSIAAIHGMKAIPIEEAEAIPVSCPSCGWEGVGKDMEESTPAEAAGDGAWLMTHMWPGAPCPAGTCPKCTRPAMVGLLTDDQKQEIEARAQGKTATRSGRKISNKVPPPPRRPVDNMISEPSELDAWD